ncbi:MAG: hypothetical protein ACLGPL_01770 [Acidobacteriota bacterium]
MNTYQAAFLTIIFASLLLTCLAYAAQPVAAAESQKWEQLARRGGDDGGYDDSRGRHRGRSHFEDSGRHRYDDDGYHGYVYDDNRYYFDDSYDDSGHHGGYHR